MVNSGSRQKRGRSRAREALYPIESLKTSCLQGAAQAVEVSADLLADLQAEFETSRGKSPEQSHAVAVQDIAVTLQMPVEKMEAGLPGLEAQPGVIREVLLRRIAAAWLEGPREL
jgi:hypothetical protein